MSRIEAEILRSEFSGYSASFHWPTEDTVPTISVFLGMTIRMYFSDHAPPHFHVEYNEHEALTSIADGSVLRGSLPRRALSLVVEWATMHRDELAANWALCISKQSPFRIQPLED